MMPVATVVFPTPLWVPAITTRGMLIDRLRLSTILVPVTSAVPQGRALRVCEKHRASVPPKSRDAEGKLMRYLTGDQKVRRSEDHIARTRSSRGRIEGRILLVS